jgi:3-hydroxy-3-methylglutaryl CoA synthase
MVYLWLQIVSGQEDVISMAQEASSKLLKRAGIIIPKRMNIL